jgi:hypothetical protein
MTLGSMAMVAMACGGCVHVSSDPIKIEPVRIDIYHHVDQQLNDFFQFENSVTPGAAKPAAPAPAPAPTPAP